MSKRDPFSDMPSYAQRVAKRTEKKDSRPRAMTYRIGDKVIERINQIANEHGVQKGPLVRALLTHALDDLETGQWQLPIKEEVRKKLEI